MSLELSPQTWAWVAAVGGVLLILWTQRGRLAGWLKSLKPVPKPTDPDSITHDAFACVLHLLNDLAKAGECPKASKALRFLVLPAIVDGTDPPHYFVAWKDDEAAK